MTKAPAGKKRLVLLDSHAILHRAYHALPDFSTSKGEPTGALYGLSSMLIKIIEELKPDYIVACYDLKGPTYRHEIYKEYKAGRKTADDALIAQMQTSRNIFEALNIPIYDKAGFEADDILGTITKQLENEKDLEIIIASGDMDTLQLVRDRDVRVFTLRKGITDTVMYDENGVIKRYGFGPALIPDYKGLCGDPSDNIIGVKGVGDKTATTLITNFGTIESMYKEIEAGHEEKFIKAGIKPRIIQLLKDNKEEAEFSKMLATIRRDVPISFEFPDQIFIESVDVKKANTYWVGLEFRTLTQRLERAIKYDDVAKTVTKAVPEKLELKPQNGLFVDIPSDELEQTATALWVVNSNLTNPQLTDITNFANTEDFAEAKEKVFEALDKSGYRKVYDEIELPLIPVTHKMEKRGIKIDRKVLQGLSKTYHAELEKIEKKVWDLAGMNFNIASPKQLGEVLFDKLGIVGKNMKKTSGGARSTRESELEKLRDKHPIVPLIFEHRELSKLLSTYIDAIPPQLDKNDRLHTNFIPTGSATGRMASQNPNLQNIPIKTDLGKAIRNAFIAEKGFKLASFDYSQMELRIAAFMSGDEKLIEIFKRGEDVHTSVASQVFKVKPEEVTSDMRRQAKVINFGIIYGMGVLALKANLGTSREEAQDFLNRYFETFKTLANYLDNIKKSAAKNGYTETFFGRRRYFEGINSKIPYIKSSAERMAINAPFQGTGADIIKIAMIKIDKYITENRLDEKVFALVQVHDELVYEIKEDLAEKISTEIEKLMESVIDIKDTAGVPLKASAHIGDNWGELK